MSAATIHIPVQHAEAIRRSLVGRRAEAEHREAVDSLLGQLSAECGDGARSYELTGPRPLLWSAVYDALCSAAEQLAEDCNDLWRGTIDASVTRAGIADVSARLDLLTEVGDPPGS